MSIAALDPAIFLLLYRTGKYEALRTYCVHAGSHSRASPEIYDCTRGVVLKTSRRQRKPKQSGGGAVDHVMDTPLLLRSGTGPRAER